MLRTSSSALECRTALWRVVGCCAWALPALAIWLAVGEGADASCGDYVLVRDASGRLVPMSQLAGGGMQEHSTPAKAPCHGPSCSGLPALPPAVPAAPVVVPVSPEGLITACEDFGDPDLAQHRSEQSSLRPIHYPGRVYRPPRS